MLARLSNAVGMHFEPSSEKKKETIGNYNQSTDHKR